MVDWTNPEAHVSRHFKVKETLFLHQWNCLHIPSDAEKANIIKLAGIIDQVRDFLGLPISVHCWIRPILNNPASPYNGQDYNALVGGAPHSAHRIGSAIDFDAGEYCDNTRAKLLPNLALWGLRMEKRDHSDWVHLDDYPVPPGGNRYFIP